LTTFKPSENTATLKMSKKIKITKKDKFLNEKIFIDLLNDMINDSYAGRRLKSNGKKISDGTVKNYEYLKKQIIAFTEFSSFEIKIYIVNNLTQTERERANIYYKKFYKAFTNFMYNEKKYYDNYVGLIIKCLRSFFNYLEKERNISVGFYHKSFFVPIEEIPIIALTHEQLNYIIYNAELTERVKQFDLDKIKDIFVFGCTVALRVSDLLNLSRENLEIQGDKYYIKVKSQKTSTFTSIKLPDYAVEILLRYMGKHQTLLPPISAAWFNTRLKDLAKLMPDDFEIVKTRERKGEHVIVYKNPKKKMHYKLYDHISTHTMRKTAITNMLCLGMPEHLVRKISGHAVNSREFFRYVQLSQSFIDDETDRFFDKVKSL